MVTIHAQKLVEIRYESAQPQTSSELMYLKAVTAVFIVISSAYMRIKAQKL